MLANEAASKPRRSGAPTAMWVIAVLLAFIAGTLWNRPMQPVALAQNTPLAGGRGVFAFTGQIGHNEFGLFMLDIEQGTVWCYEMDDTGGVKKLKLAAARSWIYDRYLREFNVAAPTPKEIKDLVAQERARPSDDDAARGSNSATGDKDKSKDN
ncbi:MAG: hypothetical protein HZB38_07250 [Planctomycetes bacterium]|nr:hypothetical protein [Planctomycetota bacterium]